MNQCGSMKGINKELKKKHCLLKQHYLNVSFKVKTYKY